MNPLGLVLRRIAVVLACASAAATCFANGFKLDQPPAPIQPRLSADQIFAAQSMNDLAVATGGEDLFLALIDCVAALAANDPPAADRAVEKISKLGGATLQGPGWNFSRHGGRGMNVGSSFVGNMAMIRATPATLGLAWRFFGHSADGQYAPKAWPSMQGWQQVLLRSFTDARGWEQPTNGTNAMLGPMTKMIGDDTPQLFWQGSAALAMEIDPWEQLVLVHEAWKKCRAGDPDQNVARIMRASMQLQGHRFRRDIPKEASVDWNQRSAGLLNVLRDLVTKGYAGPPGCLADAKKPDADKLKPPYSKCQFAVAASVTHELAPLPDPVIVETGIEAGCVALESGEPADENGWETLLRAFNELPTDEQWQGLAQRYLDAMLREPAPATWGYEAITQSLDVAARLGDRDLFGRITQRYPSHSALPRRFIVLVRSGHRAMAEEWLRRNVDTFSYRSSGDIGWRPSDLEAVDRFSENLPEPELKLLARILMTINAPDDESLPRERAAQHFPRSSETITKLTAEFAAAEFNDKVDRSLCLRLLAESPQASRVVEHALAEEFARNPPQLEVAGLRDVIGDRLAVAAAAVVNEAARGHLEPLRQLMADIGKAAPLPAKRWLFDSAQNELLSRLGNGATAFTPTANAAELASWRDALQEAFTLENGQMTDVGKVSALCDMIALHGLTQSMDKLAAWRAGLPEAKRAAYAKGLRIYSARVAPAVSALLRRNDDDLLPLPQRIQLLITILNDPWIAESTSQISDLLHQFCGMRVFTGRELLDNAPLLLKECPREGRTARELAAMAWQANLRNKVEPFLAAAREAATNPALKARFALAAQSMQP